MKLFDKLKAAFAPAAFAKLRTGRSGEDLAAKYLEDKGYKVIARNFRVKGGEADLIASFEGRTVVVEVKTRTTAKFGSPQAAVDRRKYKRLLLAGTIFCRTRKLPLKHLRIDVVAVEIGSKEPSIRHFENIVKPFSRTFV